MTVVAELRFETLDPAAELAAILSLGEGAVVSFVGVARPHRPQEALSGGGYRRHREQDTGRGARG